MLAAADALHTARLGANTLQRRIVFLALAGDSWDYMGSRRLLWEMRRGSNATAGLDLNLIDQVWEQFSRIFSWKVHTQAGSGCCRQAMHQRSNLKAGLGLDLINQVCRCTVAPGYGWPGRVLLSTVNGNRNAHFWLLIRGVCVATHRTLGSVWQTCSSMTSRVAFDRSSSWGSWASAAGSRKQQQRSRKHQRSGRHSSICTRSTAVALATPRQLWMRCDRPATPHDRCGSAAQVAAGLMCRRHWCLTDQAASCRCVLASFELAT